MGMICDSLSKWFVSAGDYWGLQGYSIIISLHGFENWHINSNGLWTMVPILDDFTQGRDGRLRLNTCCFFVSHCCIGIWSIVSSVTTWFLLILQIWLFWMISSCSKLSLFVGRCHIRKSLAFYGLSKSEVHVQGVVRFGTPESNGFSWCTTLKPAWRPLLLQATATLHDITCTYPICHGETTHFIGENETFVCFLIFLPSASFSWILLWHFGKATCFAPPGGLQRSDLTWLRALPKAGGRTRPQRVIRGKVWWRTPWKFRKLWDSYGNVRDGWLQLILDCATWAPVWALPMYHVGLSKNTGCPQNGYWIRRMNTNHQILGHPIFRQTRMCIYVYVYTGMKALIPCIPCLTGF